VILLAVLAVILFAVAVSVGVTAVGQTRVRRSETIDQIEAYGYVGRRETPASPGKERRQALDALASRLGEFVSRKLLKVDEAELQRELVSAGFFGIGARRFLGYRLLLAIALPILLVWLFALAGMSVLGLVVFALIGFVFGWLGPAFVVHRRARTRLDEIDRGLPALIDLLVVTLEAGVSFTAAMRMASQRLSGPIGEEIRLTIQEQSLGLSTLEALENWLKRCDTPAVRGFVRAMVQGDRLGVSIGHILRNQAVEMRARQKASIEERAQKAPVKILFPLVFLIFPAMFVMILGPAMFTIAHSLHS
jgi:tight adherence protein C